MENYGIFRIMGNAGFRSPAVLCTLAESPPEVRCRNLIGVADSAETEFAELSIVYPSTTRGRNTFSMKPFFSGVSEPYYLSPNIVPHKRFSGPSKHLFFNTL